MDIPISVSIHQRRSVSLMTVFLSSPLVILISILFQNFLGLTPSNIWKMNRHHLVDVEEEYTGMEINDP